MSTDTDSVVFTPKKPIEYNGKTYPTLTFQEADAGALALADTVKGELSATLAILSSMADVPIGVIQKIKASDLARLNALVGPLMGETGNGDQDTGQT